MLFGKKYHIEIDENISQNVDEFAEEMGCIKIVPSYNFAGIDVRMDKSKIWNVEYFADNKAKAREDLNYELNVLWFRYNSEKITCSQKNAMIAKEIPSLLVKTMMYEAIYVSKESPSMMPLIYDALVFAGDTLSSSVYGKVETAMTGAMNYHP